MCAQGLDCGSLSNEGAGTIGVLVTIVLDHSRNSGIFVSFTVLGIEFRGALLQSYNPRLFYFLILIQGL